MTPTLADEMLLAAQPQDVKDAIQRLHPDDVEIELLESRCREKIMCGVRRDIWKWFELNGEALPAEKISSLIAYIDLPD